MSGRRPDTAQVWNFVNHFRQPGVGQTLKSMPQWFTVFCDDSLMRLIGGVSGNVDDAAIGVIIGAVMIGSWFRA